jgi:hypothetical protein
MIIRSSGDGIYFGGDLFLLAREAARWAQARRRSWSARTGRALA